MSFLSEHALSIRFRDTWLGKILMIAAIGVLCYGSAYRLIADPKMIVTDRGLYCAIEAALYALLAIPCLIPKVWRSRWFACFIVAFWAFQAGRVLGWAIVCWMDPHVLSRGTNYWLQAFPRVSFYALAYSPFMAVIPALLPIVPILQSATNRAAAAIAFLGLTLLLAIPGGVMFIASGTAAIVALGFALLALVWPRAAISVVGLLIMIPLAAAGAGTLGSIGIWNND